MFSIFKALLGPLKTITVSSHSYESFLYSDTSTLESKKTYVADNLRIENVMSNDCSSRHFEEQLAVSIGDLSVRRTDNSAWNSTSINIKNSHGEANFSQKMDESQNCNKIREFLTASDFGVDWLTIKLVCDPSNIEHTLRWYGGYSLIEGTSSHVPVFPQTEKTTVKHNL